MRKKFVNQSLDYGSIENYSVIFDGKSTAAQSLNFDKKSRRNRNVAKS